MHYRFLTFCGLRLPQTSLLKLLSSVLLALSVQLFSTQTLADADEAKLQKIKATMEALKKELSKTKSERDRLLKTLEEAEKDVSTLDKKAKKLEKQLNNRQEKLIELKDERSQLNKQKKTQQGLVSGYINAAYRLGQQSNIRLLLNQEDPSRVTRNMYYYNRLINARTEKIDEYVSTLKRIDEIEPEIAYQKQQLAQDVKQVNQQREALKKAQKQRKSAVAKLNQSIQSQDQQLSALKIDRERLERVLNSIGIISDSETKAHTDAITSMKGRLPWPTKGKLSRSFGSSRVSNKMKWQGWLIKSKPGAPVHAIHNGQVVFADYLRGHGLLMVIDHGKGFLSLYAHNQALYKELGEWVDGGEMISSVGDSGGLSDHALYFELRRNGKPINPRSWLNKSA